MHPAGGDDSLMLSGQSRIDTFSQHQMDQNGGDSSSSGSSSSSSSSNSYDNHNMAASSPADHYYRSMGTRRSSSSPAATNAANNYRISHQSRNFYPAIDDDVPEPLPMPMAAQQSAEESADSALSSCLTSNSGGVNCTQGSSVIPSADRVNNTQTAPLVISWSLTAVPAYWGLIADFLYNWPFWSHPDAKLDSLPDNQNVRTLSFPVHLHIICVYRVSSINIEMLYVNHQKSHQININLYSMLIHLFITWSASDVMNINDWFRLPPAVHALGLVN